LLVATCCGACEDTASACLSQHVSACDDSRGSPDIRSAGRPKVQSSASCAA
jgi:hypothetical protein